jgi:dihydrolipoamide dehydrogenase
LSVILVEQEKALGGQGLFQGILPSKWILSVLHQVEGARRLNRAGLTKGKVEVDLPTLRRHLEEQSHVVAARTRQQAMDAGIRVLQGRAALVHSRQVRVDHSEGTEDLQADFVVLATGATPVIPKPFEGLIGSTRQMVTAHGGLIPEQTEGHTLVVGGSTTGLEIATIHHLLGRHVTLVEQSPRLLPDVDEDLSTFLRDHLSRQFSGIKTSTSIQSVTLEKGKLDVRLENLGETFGLTADTIVLAGGMKPRSDGLGLLHTGVKVRSDGAIEVDEQARTNDPSIFALGDVTGSPMLWYKGQAQAMAAVAAMTQAVVALPRWLPHRVHTVPELVWVGISESEARLREVPYQTRLHLLEQLDQPLAFQQERSLLKLIFEKPTQRLLGVGYCGSHGDRVGQEALVALEMGAVAEDLEGCFSTLSSQSFHRFP